MSEGPIKGDRFEATPSGEGEPMRVDHEQRMVAGETESKEWTEEQDRAAMERRLKIKSQEEIDEEKRKELENYIAEWEDEPTQPG